MQHREVRVGWQLVCVPQRAQRLEHEAGWDERAARDAEHGRIRDAEALGSDCGTEVDLVAHDHLGQPLTTERDDLLGSLARDAARERCPDRPRFAILIDGEQRQTLLRGEQAGSAGGERLETRRLDRRDHSHLTCERDDMAGPLGGAGDRNERQKVAGAAGKGEQDPHCLIQAKTCGHSW